VKKASSGSAVPQLILFASAYLCGTAFPNYTATKTKYRNRLNTVPDLKSQLSSNERNKKEFMKKTLFVVDKAALGQVFSEYFGFPCQSFHQFLHHHNGPGLAQWPRAEWTQLDSTPTFSVLLSWPRWIQQKTPFPSLQPNTTSIIAYVFVAAGTCLPSRWLGVNFYSGSAIPAFRLHVAVYIDVHIPS
jgi:hypothetical protein